MSDSKLYTIELGGDLGDIAAMHRLVRCRDCRWACVPDDDGGYDVYLLACTWWMDVSRSSGDLFVEEDDFCSHGEKREAER